MGDNCATGQAAAVGPNSSVQEAARIGGVSGASAGAVVPPVGGPGEPDELAEGDDGVGQVEERSDDGLAAFVAALEPVEGVVPGVDALGGPAGAGLDRGRRALVRDLAVQSAADQRGPCGTGQRPVRAGCRRGYSSPAGPSGPPGVGRRCCVGRRSGAGETGSVTSLGGSSVFAGFRFPRE
jgi:hypothetical protein